MLAIVKENREADFILRDVDIPEPKADEVLIRVESVGICGTDIPIFKGIRPVDYPLIPGHEFAGVIVRAGDAVSRFAEGDRVVPGLVVHCGTCRYCRQGLESLCDAIYEIGIHVNGAFAEYVVAPEKTLHRLPEGLHFNQGALIDPLASAYRPVRKARISSSDFVVIYGPGPIGLFALQVARAEGAGRILVVGAAGDTHRLALAKRLGADFTVNGQDHDPVERIRELTSGKMADVVIEATGVPAVVEPCINSLKKNGRLSLAGIFHEAVPVALGDVVRRELRISGSICYTWLDFQACIDLVAAGKVDLAPMISHEFPLTEMGEALNIAYRRESIKIIMHPRE
ncbi:alcohol dehydrogenase [Desulfosarcina ovata subsp. sediminis]|uniref:Alcohol dehydrogenase n=1 Tax=Desulfosarcina ovata subsp. sediminis TaxID=885957 RepID=A0A5K7ZQS5_9BACT|nr:alcohol dehydrogenase catalytic domain-containing protein [Desulfosarcina ovata]BBO79913.1 alcohol dehydrogenase [Desulfosarcina ovata subsp. sediminis]